MTIWQALRACKLNIFGNITNPVSTFKWKQTFKTAAWFLYPILSIVIFLRPWFFSLRSPSLLLKRLLWVQLLILPVCLHKHTKSSLDRLWSLSSLHWNSLREPLDWLQSAPQGTEAEPHICHLASPVPVVSLKSLRLSLCLQVPFYPSFRKATFVPSLERLPRTAQLTKVPGFFSWAFASFTSQSQFLRASWWRPEPRHASFRRDIPVKVPVNKPPLMTGLSGFMQRNLMYVITHSFRMPNSGGIR